MTHLHEQIKHYIAPVGEGVYTLSSAKEYKEDLQQQLYKAIGDKVIPEWESHIAEVDETTKPLVLGIGSDAGGGILRGANWGPLFIRNYLYKIMDPHNVCDLGDIRVIPQLLLDEYHNDTILSQCRAALYGNNHLNDPVSPLSITQKVVSQILKQSPMHTILGLGGDHSVSYALIKPYLTTKKNQNINAAILQFDAHTDLLENRLGIPVSFGSWTYHILDALNSSANLIQIGIRASQKPQNEWEQNYGIKQIWASDANTLTIPELRDQLLKYLKKLNIDELYITVDIDALDISEAAATGTPEPGGLKTDTVISLIQALAQHYPITGADIMEVAPFSIPLSAADQRLAEPQNTLSHAADIAKCIIENLGIRTT